MRRGTLVRVCRIALVLGVGGAASLVGQEPAARPGALRVFLDCQNFFCDFDHFRRVIGFVDWMRDQRDAQVHVLGTTLESGGGEQFTLTFIGRGDFAGRTDTLVYNSSRTDTDDEEREGLARTLALGLVRFAAALPIADHLDVQYRAPAAGLRAAAGPAADPWNFWLFRVEVEGFISGETRQRSYSGEGSVSANRTTEDLKIDLGMTARFRRSEFELTDTTEFVDVSKRISSNGVIVWSLGRHWSAGLQGSVSASTFLNQRLVVRGGPALEYNVFPYEESTRKQLTVLYRPGIVALNYDEETIFDRTSEVRPVHLLEISLAVQQPWGTLFGFIQGSQFLHDLAAHRLEVGGGLELRIVRGLSLDVFGEVSRIKDQIFLPKAGLSEEEILTERRQQGTDFEFQVEVGLSFTFGSIFNNVVNPRLNDATGFFF